MTTGKAPEPRVVVYALGGGHGHAVRGSALAAALKRRGADSLVLLPQPRASIARALGAAYRPIARPKAAPELVERVEAALAEHRAQHLVIDTFPEGLYDELAGLRGDVHRTALLRCRTDAEGPRLRRGLCRCALALDLEPHLGWRPPTLAAEPFGPVIRPLTPTEPRADVLVLGTEPPLQGFARRLVARLSRRGLRIVHTDAEGLHGLDEREPGPLLSAAALGARVVVGPAGFNLTYEVQALGGWHVALARPRPYDDQSRRARVVAHQVGSPQAVERLVLQLLRAPPPADRRPTVRLADDLAAHLLARWGAPQAHA